MPVNVSNKNLLDFVERKKKVDIKPMGACPNLKPGCQGFQALYLGVLQSGVRVDGVKHLQDLVQASLERVELPKNVHLTEVKMSF